MRLNEEQVAKIVDLYVNKEMSTIDVERTLHINKSVVMYHLRQLCLMRSISEAKKLDHKRHPKIPRCKKFCEKCGDEFAGTKLVAYKRWCSDCCPNATARQRLCIYDLSQPEFDALLKSQGNKCLLCGIEGPTNVDHDHSDGRLRGILCNLCNTLLGSIERVSLLDPKFSWQFNRLSSDWVKKATDYLTKNCT